MAKRNRSRKSNTARIRRAKSQRHQKREQQNQAIKSGLVKKRRGGFSRARLERGLLILRSTGDLKTASRAIRVRPEQFKRAATRKRAIRKVNGGWKITARLSRRMPIFSDGKHLAITVSNKTASAIGRYNSAVGKFLQTNNPKHLAPFRDRTVKDVRGKIHTFETRPNALYQLSSAGGEPFEDVYRIVL